MESILKMESKSTLGHFQSPFILKVETTPNPNSYKVVISHSFMGEDMWDCSDLQSAEDSYLARELWKIDAPKVHQAIENIFFHDIRFILTKIAVKVNKKMN